MSLVRPPCGGFLLFVERPRKCGRRRAAPIQSELNSQALVLGLARRMCRANSTRMT
ncbi:hypothetical protein [Lysobacter gummosus]|uniref:hypothetical protein n=1 Tax=Lysobacter gummosus TaxID=262324 RepID=UPI003633178C